MRPAKKNEGRLRSKRTCTLLEGIYLESVSQTRDWRVGRRWSVPIMDMEMIEPWSGATQEAKNKSQGLTYDVYSEPWNRGKRNIYGLIHSGNFANVIKLFSMSLNDRVPVWGTWTCNSRCGKDSHSFSFKITPKSLLSITWEYIKVSKHTHDARKVRGARNP